MIARTLVASTLVGVGCGLLAAPPVGAVTFPPATFGVAPAARFAVARPPAGLGPLLVANTTRRSYDVRVVPVLLGQRVDGAFQAQLDKRSRRSAARALALTASRFTLRPGEQRSVQARWTRALPGARSAALGALVLGRPHARTASASVVGAQSAIVSLAFAQRPGRVRARGAVVGLRAEQAGARRLRLLSRVRNQGREVARPRRGRVVVRNARGRVVFARAWGRQQLDLVVPGATIDFPVTVARVLPAGRYTARTSALIGHRRTSRTTSFRLLGPNRLPTVRLRIASVRATAQLNGSAHVRVEVTNTGTATAAVDGGATLIRLGPAATTRPVGHQRLHGRSLPPGATGVLQAQLGPLRSGRHRVAVALRGPGDAHQAATDVLPAPHARSGRRAGAGRVAQVAAGTGIAVVVAGLGGVLHARRRRRRSDGRVDVNRATAAELLVLPGIGPATAAQIVAHRDRHGSFASVEDLSAVPGLGARRIAALRGAVRT